MLKLIASGRRSKAAWLAATAFVLVLGYTGTLQLAQAADTGAAPAPIAEDRPGENAVVTPEDGRPVYVQRGTGAQMNYPTEINTVILNSEQTGGNFTLTDQRWLPGDWTNTHYHKSTGEAFYIIDGEIDVTVGTQDITMKAGDVVYLPPHTLHKLTTKKEGKGAHVLLIVTPGPAGGFPWPTEYNADGTLLDTH